MNIIQSQSSLMLKDPKDLIHIPRLTRLFRDTLLLLFSCQVMPSALQLHGLQHARLLCPPLSPEVCSNSRPLSE